MHDYSVLTVQTVSPPLLTARDKPAECKDPENTISPSSQIPAFYKTGSHPRASVSPHGGCIPDMVDLSEQMMSFSAGQRQGEQRKKPRKKREPKSCYSCRRRKVKCDGVVPCSSCTLRGDPQLCSMDSLQSILRQPSRDSHSSSSPSISAAVGNASWSSPNAFATGMSSGADVSALSSRQPSPHSAEASTSPARLLPQVSAIALNGVTTDQNQKSYPSYNTGRLAAVNPTAARQQRVDKNWSHNMSELAGGGSNVVLPLEDLYSQKSMADLCLALPSNNQIQRYYQLYSDILLPIYPGIVNPDRFTAELQSFLDDRDRIVANADNAPHTSHSHDASWFALLFSVLACGAQCLSTTDDEAELNSKVFGSISLSCLRKANFLVYPSINSIQALLHIGNSVRNDMNPGTAWSLLGLTIRHAQVIDCHEQQPSIDTDEVSNELAITKLKLWWAVVWQDMILTMTYGRPSGILSVKARLPPILDPNGCYTFVDVIDRLCNVCLELCRMRLLTEDVVSIEDAHRLVRNVEEIHLKAQPHLLSTSNCMTVRQHVEYFAVIIYTNHAAAQLLQSALPEPSLHIDENGDQQQIYDIVIEKNATVVKAFLRLRQVSVLSSHYWSLLQVSVTAAKFLVTRVHPADRLQWNPLVKALISSLRGSCDEFISVRNGFSTSLSQIVADLTMTLEGN